MLAQANDEAVQSTEVSSHGQLQSFKIFSKKPNRAASRQISIVVYFEVIRIILAYTNIMSVG
jgi:hypothetical protein